MRHDAVLQEIRRLDPVVDHQRIAFLTSLQEFPWDTTRSLELALFRAFAVAKGTGLLAGTGEFTKRTQKRYDDTVLILAEILEHGYDSERGKAALRRMNQMHGRYAIPNDEFLYVLSTFVFEPIRWNERFGWRPLLRQEKLASFYFWREIARRMAIKDVPDDYEAFERYYEEFARRELRVRAREPARWHARRATCSWLVSPEAAVAARPAVRPRDDGRPPARCGRLAAPAPRGPARSPRAPSGYAAGSSVGCPPRRQPRLITQQRHPTYPNGYTIEELGVH